MANNTTVVVHPCPQFSGTLRMPGDKSITHRIVLLASLARGTTTATGFLDSDDSRIVLAALRQLGVVSRIDAGRLIIEGRGPWYRPPAEPLNLGNSGTGMRLLAGILAGQPFTTTMAGDISLNSRPMQRIQKPLALLGAKVELLGAKGCPPMRITGGRLRGIEYILPEASAQVKSCILLAGLFAGGTTTVVEPVPTRDHLERILQRMGIPLTVDQTRITLPGVGPDGPNIAGCDWKVPGDFSSAAFWITAAAVAPGRELIIEDVGLNPRRTALLDVLRRMGARIEVQPATAAGACEEMGAIRVRGAALRGTEVGGGEVPNLIDELPLVAVAGALAFGRTVISGAAELRVKESDRIAVMTANLRRLGVPAEERPDGMIIEGGSALAGGVDVESYGDHRVPMAMSVLAFSAARPVRMLNCNCVAKSYPGFWDDARRLGVWVEHDRSH